jgi:uncharacterized protein
VKEECPDFVKAEAFIISLLKENLSPELMYHNIGHTLDVLDAALKISESENISADEIKLLRIAVLFHDAGFVHVYKNHEETGCEMVREYLPRFGFTNPQIATICEMIMSTQIPQRPKTRLDRIIADADLDYLGRDDVYTIAQKLYEEMKLHNQLSDDRKWLPFQINFLKQHEYFTGYSKENREAGKNLYLDELIEKMRSQ